MAIKFNQVYFQGWILFFFKLCCPGGLAHSFLPTLYMCQDQGKAYSWLQWLISLSPCSSGSLFHWPSADISPLPSCELSFCFSSMTTSYLTPNFTAEKVHCSAVRSILWGTLKSNCKQVLTKLGDRKKIIKAGLKQDAEVCCHMLKFLMFGLVFLFWEERGVGVKWLLQSHKCLGWQEKVGLLGLLFRSIHGTYCWSYSQSPLLP